MASVYLAAERIIQVIVAAVPRTMKSPTKKNSTSSKISPGKKKPTYKLNNIVEKLTKVA